jgi:hypothetical protein
MIRSAIRLVTVAALLLALAVSILWWVDPQREWLQAPSTALVLIAAVAGIPADRWAAETQRRNRALAAIQQEIEQNRDILADDRFRSENQGVGQVYPRLILSAVDMAFIANALDTRRDLELRRCLLDWRNAAVDLNRRLDITEQRLCMIDYLDHHELLSLREIRRPEGYFDRVCQLLEAVEGRVERASEDSARAQYRRLTEHLRRPMVNRLRGMRVRGSAGRAASPGWTGRAEP